MEPVLLEKFYSRLKRQGCLAIIDTEGRAHVCGSGTPVVTVRLHDPALHWKLFLRPEISAGEAYMEGTLTLK